MEPSGAVWLDDCCNLWVGNEVGQVGDVPNDGEGVLGVDPVHHLLLLLNIARDEQARHTEGSQVMHQLLRGAYCLVPELFPLDLIWPISWATFFCRQLQCGFSGSSPKVCCPAPSLPRKAVEGGGNPAVVNVDAVKFPAPLVNLGNLNDVNVNSNLDNRGLHARTGNFPLAQEETSLWSEEFGPKWCCCCSNKCQIYFKTWNTNFLYALAVS